MRTAVASTLFLVLLHFSPAAMSEDNATIFFYGAPPTFEQITEWSAGARSKLEREGPISRFVIEWPDVSLVIYIDPNWDRTVQLSGIRGWLAQLPKSERASPLVRPFLGDLERTTTSYGSVISPGYDAEGKVVAILKRILAASGGFFFSHQSLYTAEGRRIAGASDDPPALGAR